MKKVIVHAGFHRCASTAIQSLLLRRRAEIEATGTRLLLRDDLMTGFFGQSVRLLYRHRQYLPQAQVRLARARTGLKASRADTILISEENLVGMMPGLFSHRFYPSLAHFIRALALLSRSVEIHPRFVVRRQDRFLESVYAFRVFRGYTLSFADFLASTGARSLSWFMLVRQLERYGLDRTARLALLEAWPKEEAPAMAMEFLGHGHIPLPQDERLSGNPSLGRDALKLLLAMNRMELGMDKEWRKQTFLPLLRSSGPGVYLPETAGLPVTAEIRATLADNLAQDISVGFTDGERNDLMNFYTRHNAEFLGHPIVGQPTELWH